MSERHVPTPLDRHIPIPGWFGLSAIVLLVIASVSRFYRLDTYLLNMREASWAYDSWSLYYGRPLPIGQHLPDSGPFMLIWNTVPYYLFGVTDATARIGSALLGLGLIAIVFLLRPFLSQVQVITIAGILAISPTMVFASRTVEPGIMAAFFAVLILVTLLRCGLSSDGSAAWAGILGLALASLYATGPVGVSTLLALSIGIIAAAIRPQPGRLSDNAIGVAVRRTFGNRQTLLSVFIGLLVGLLVLFSRVFSSLSSLTGIGTTMTDWVNVMIDGSSNIPALFYFWSLLLYETIAVILAIVTLVLARSGRMRRPSADRQVPVSFFATWFVAALLLHTVASTRDTGSAVLVVLPVLLLAGMGLGALLETALSTKSVGGVVSGALALLLVMSSLSAMIGLAFTSGESGSEPLAHDTPASEARDFLDQVMRLSRDISVTEPTKVDPTGRYGLTIQATPEYQWPFMWYFRNFEGFSVTPAGAFTSDTDVSIAANAEVMDSVGLTASNRTWFAKPGDPLVTMRTGSILSTGLNPANWGDAWNYMVHRDPPGEEGSRTITIGYSIRVMNKLTTATGPYNLFDGLSPGEGSGLGQLEQPTGIAAGADGTIYVLNAANARVDRYSSDGTFIGIWDGQIDTPLQLSWNGWEGGSDLSVGPDGLIYIADTWNHAVVIVSPNGKVVRVLGYRGTQTDITDAGSPLEEPGLFFGPRGVEITEDRIYVTDTGNERVQVFGMDGTFVTAFGGYGSKDGQFIEPTGIAIAPDGVIWVADSGNARLQTFDSDGNWIATYDVPEWEGQFGIDRFNALAFDANGVLFFTAPSQGVWAWHDGDRVQIEGTTSISAGGITLDADGHLLITDRYNANVVRISPVLPEGFVSPMATPHTTPQATSAD